MAIYTVYKITNLVNHKVYIGQTTRDPMTRFKEHYAASALDKPSKLLQRAIKKHGVDNFIFEIVDQTATSIDELNDLEMHYINVYESFSDRSKGYNMTKGGEGGNGEMVSRIQKERVANGTHHWACGRSREINLKRLQEGTHPTQNEEITKAHSLRQKKLAAEGKLAIQTEAVKEKRAATHKRMVADGTHTSQTVHTCPQCGKVGKGHLMKIHHFDNCKRKRM